MNPNHTTFHPKWHRERLPIFWWLRRWNYTKFITRELTSLFVAYTVLLLLWQVRAVSAGPAAYERLQEWLRSPAALVLHGVVLLFLLIHSVTWLNLAPRAIAVKIGNRRIPDRVVLLAHYLMWLAASAGIAFFLLWRW